MPPGRPKGTSTGPAQKWTDEEKLAFLQKLIFTSETTISVPREFNFRDRTFESLRQTLNGMKKEFLKPGNAADKEKQPSVGASEWDDELIRSPVKDSEKKPKTPRKRKVAAAGDDSTPASKNERKKAKATKSEVDIMDEVNEQSEAI